MLLGLNSVSRNLKGPQSSSICPPIFNHIPARHLNLSSIAKKHVGGIGCSSHVGRCCRFPNLTRAVGPLQGWKRT
eukprot:3443053-Pyramimonas_sp.AAC.1